MGDKRKAPVLPAPAIRKSSVSSKLAKTCKKACACLPAFSFGLKEVVKNSGVFTPFVSITGADCCCCDYSLKTKLKLLRLLPPEVTDNLTVEEMATPTTFKSDVFTTAIVDHLVTPGDTAVAVSSPSYSITADIAVEVLVTVDYSLSCNGCVVFQGSKTFMVLPHINE